MVDRQARKRIQTLEERAAQRDCETAELSARLSRGAGAGAADFARLGATVDAMRASGLFPSPAVPSHPPTPAPSAPSVSAATPPDAPSSAAAPDPLPPQAPPPAPSAVALPAAPAGFASLIVADFPALFAEFRGMRFMLLWRGCRGGFGAGDFHGLCDGHAPTLPLIQDTEGSIFGGFTPVEWESRTNPPYFKADPSLKSFVFTLKNPHNFTARKFALKAEKKDRAIYCDSEWGPRFYGIAVSDDCNANTDSFSCLGETYKNNIGLHGGTFLTRLFDFTVKEIEVFEIAD
jgi:hypothetical protein